MRRPVRFVPIARDTLRRSPLAPPCKFKRQFLLGFNNYLRSALTLRGVSSVGISSAPLRTDSALPHLTVWRTRTAGDPDTSVVVDGLCRVLGLNSVPGKPMPTEF
jgi:hypothetical protein